jgi:hypothetical protein
VGNLTGILNDNELHLTEVKGVLSVRPNLTYLDKSDKRAKQEGRTFAALFCVQILFLLSNGMRIHKGIWTLMSIFDMQSYLSFFD